MSKKDFSKDALDTLGLNNLAPVIEENQLEKAQQKEPTKKEVISVLKKPDKNAQEENLVRRSYFMTPELHRALKIRAVQENKEISVLLREAVAAFLK